MAEGVQFEEDQAGMGRRMGGQYGGQAGSQSKMVRWLMAKGLAKSPSVGQGILLAVVVVNAIIVYVLLKYFLY